jgi:hypothetical protein
MGVKFNERGEVVSLTTSAPEAGHRLWFCDEKGFVITGRLLATLRGLAPTSDVPRITSR